MRHNILLNTDSYKTSHWLQYPPETMFVSSYIEARGGVYDEIVFFGLQAFIKEYLLTPFTLEDINQADAVLTAHGVPFNRAGWIKMLYKYDGHIPVTITALEEGSVVPVGIPLVQVVNTDPEFPWLTSYLETALLRAVWYPSTVATVSREAKKIIKKAMEETCDNLDGLDFKLHDFGARGVSSLESAGLGGMAHMINFQGSDTITGLLYARKYYGAGMPAFSIPAAEHSTITCWGKANESKAYENMIRQFSKPGTIYSVVSDSYDIMNACKNIWGDELHTLVRESGGTLVVRPDSGDPVQTPIDVILCLMDKFGFDVNSKGYKVLPDYIRVIQGDGIVNNDISEILRIMQLKRLSADNIAFGMGGGLLQQVNRDTCKWAMKASAIYVDGKWRDVFKEPVGDVSKKSKRGLLVVEHKNDEWTWSRLEDVLMSWEYVPELGVIYQDGTMYGNISFDEIRENAVV